MKTSKTRGRKTDLLQGTLDLIILQMLQSQALNGYELTQRINVLSRDVLTVNAGSLYPALYRLEARGWIQAAWRLSGTNRRARFYSMTAPGRRQLATERATWERFAGALAAILRTS